MDGISVKLSAHSGSLYDAINFENRGCSPVFIQFIRTYKKHRNMNDQPNNPLHGLTLEKILSDLVNHYGWDELYKMIEIRCFYNDPSIKSSLKFLRKTNWARVKIEEIYKDLISQEKKEM